MAVADPELANGGARSSAAGASIESPKAPSGGSKICKRGAKVERRRREYRGAEGAEESKVCGGGFSLPIEGGSGPHKFFLILDLKMSTSSAF